MVQEKHFQTWVRGEGAETLAVFVCKLAVSQERREIRQRLLLIT